MSKNKNQNNGGKNQNNNSQNTKNGEQGQPSRPGQSDGRN